MLVYDLARRLAHYARRYSGLLMLPGLATCGLAGQGTPSAPSAPSHAAIDATPPATPMPSRQPATSSPTPPADLAVALFQQGDLPPGIAAGPETDPIPANFEDSPPAATIIGRRFVRDGRSLGRVSLLLYASSADRAQAYERLTASLRDAFSVAGNEPRPKPDVGEDATAVRSTLASSTYGTEHMTIIVFTRCSALVDIRLFERADLTGDMAAAYASRLDRRLMPLVCAAPSAPTAAPS